MALGKSSTTWPRISSSSSFAKQTSEDVGDLVRSSRSAAHNRTRPKRKAVRRTEARLTRLTPGRGIIRLDRFHFCHDRALVARAGCDCRAGNEKERPPWWKAS